jgi:hypothetical protein
MFSVRYDFLFASHAAMPLHVLKLNINTVKLKVKVKVKVKLKSSRNRPGVAQRVPGGLGSQIFTTFGTRRW